MNERNSVEYPIRINFNFLSKCNMSCAFCYCPFDAKESEFDIWKKIIDRSAQWGIKGIIFGGGDPFIYKKFPDLLDYTFERFQRNIFIQLDTNGLGLYKKHYFTVKKTVGLLGLPLDGSNSDIHGSMRGHRTHFRRILHLLQEFTQMHVSINVNTVVSRINAHDLTAMAEVLSRFSIKAWALYEFWPLGPLGIQYADRFLLPHDSFLELAYSIKNKYHFTNIEIGSIQARWHTYFFVSHTGRAYTINHENSQNYVELGPIFDDDVLEKWNMHARANEVEAQLLLRRSYSDHTT